MTYVVDLGDKGKFEVEDEIFRVIKAQQNQINSNVNLPKFFHLKRNFINLENTFTDFYAFIMQNEKRSSSQLFQDLFAYFFCGQTNNGTFLEFGATDGASLSNTLFLEKYCNWQGLLIEPSPQWHAQLKKNRVNAKISTDCVFSSTGEKVSFFVSDAGVLSTIDAFRKSDLKSMPGNAEKRNENGYNVDVRTISLNDVHKTLLDEKSVDYVSIDTEGSEFEILRNFDFQNMVQKS